MTANQIRKALTAANIDTTAMEIYRDEIRIFVPDPAAPTERALESATQELCDAVCAVLPWDGYSTQYGMRIICRNYERPSNDYCGA